MEFIVYLPKSLNHKRHVISIMHNKKTVFDKCPSPVNGEEPITEGFHTKMEMMSRRAYGFRNFENYRLRVLAHCGWNGVFNRV